jgi:chemotaxis protein MotB
MKTTESRNHTDFDEMPEKQHTMLSLPVVASFVVVLMATAGFVVGKKGTLFNLVTVEGASSDSHALKTLRKSLIEKSAQYPAFREAKSDGRSIVLVLNSDQFFSVGQAEIKSAAREELLKTLKGLRELKEDFTVSVEGHTDSSPVFHYKWKYPTNWELSAFRAAAVVRLFEQVGFAPERLGVAGFGANRTKVQDRTPAGEEIEANKALNRRITLRLYPPLNSKGND